MLRRILVLFFVVSVASFVPVQRCSSASAEGYLCGAVSISRREAKPKQEPENEPVEKKPGITFQGLFDLIALGAGAPNLGKFTGVDKQTGTLNFELEKNNFKSKKTGKNYNSFDNRDGTYFEAGYVDEDADIMGKFGRMFGGKKKSEDA
jgi:hypothetical protein